MRPTKIQMIIAGVVLLLIILGILLFTGIIPGLRGDGPGGEAGYSGEITVWGVYDSEPVMRDTLVAQFKKIQPSVKVAYRLLDIANYENELINALAAGTGPDVFMVHNSWLTKHKDKMYGLDEEHFPIAGLRNAFPGVVEKDFVADGQVFALPLYIDSLAMFYNRTILDNAGVASPPTTWDQFISLIPSLRKLDNQGRIHQAAGAIGGSNRNIDRGTDLFALILMQSGINIVTGDSATFDTQDGETALGFYTNFSKPAYSGYTWDSAFLNSIDAFTQERASVIFNYSYQIPTLKAKNPFLNFSVAPMLQFNTDRAMNYANYWGLAVSPKSTNAGAAWSFVFASTMNPEVSQNYLDGAGRPPALRELIDKTSLRSDEMGVFSKQALTATSWLQVDSASTDRIFSTMLESAIGGQLTLDRALRQAKEQINELLSRYPI